MKNIFYRGLGIGALYGIVGIILAKYVFENPAFAPDYKWMIMIVVSCAMIGSIIFSNIERLRQSLYYTAKRTNRDVKFGEGNSNIFNKIIGALLIIASLALLFAAKYTYPLFIAGAILSFFVLLAGLGIFNRKKYGLQILTYIGGFLLAGAMIYSLVSVFTEYEVNRLLVRIVGIASAVVVAGIFFLYHKINDTLEY